MKLSIYADPKTRTVSYRKTQTGLSLAHPMMMTILAMLKLDAYIKIAMAKGTAKGGDIKGHKER